ncbi:protein of unknown function [Rhodovastum atsumiense]|nr:VWA domain-containing protein [Rhodovastum atsumiense]CAH2603542.1 protein of unknown function [Rhodovastum atsumiense]
MSAPAPRGRFLRALALAALAVGVPLALAAFWFGATTGGRISPARTPLEAWCPGFGLARAEAETMDLRRQLAALESALARRRPLCPICPAGAAEAAPEIAVVVDTSPSMRWPARLDAAGEAEQTRRIERESGSIDQPDGAAALNAVWARTPPGEARLDAARAAARAAITAMPPESRVHLLTFTPAGGQPETAKCSVSGRGSFGAADTASIDQVLAALQPDSSGTPLAESLRSAAAALAGRAPAPDGRPRLGLVVVVTDGAESCGGDPCAAAAELRARDPALSVTLVDIAHNRAAACLASGTLGQVVQPEDAAAVGRAVTALLAQPRQSGCIAAPAASR